jgi:hypothetical protein
MKKLKCQLFQRTNSSWLALSLLVALLLRVSPDQLRPQDILTCPRKKEMR